MLLWLIHSVGPAGLQAWEKITLRAALAAGISFALALLLGPRLIHWLRRRFREPNVSASPRLAQLHQGKQWTPTMGGLFIVAGIVTSLVVLGDLENPYVLAALVLVLGLALLGAVDDLRKLGGSAGAWLARGKDHHAKRDDYGGLAPRTKLAWQVVLAMAVALLLYRVQAEVPHGLDLALPLSGAALHLGWLFVPLAVLVIVGTSNAVNLTDGLDGLAGGCLLFAASGMALLTYCAGHSELAMYLGLIHIPGAGEMTVLAGGVIGGLLGFLWFNCHPAQVFMGDTGSLPLGGLLGLWAVVARQELLLVVVGGVFVAEAASVIVQVAWFRWKRRRVFLCAPLHHHFQFQGWPESRIVVRFWIASALCSVVALAGLKVTLREKPESGGGKIQSSARLTPGTHLPGGP